MLKKFTIKTTSRNQMINITNMVMDFVLESKIKNGIGLIFSPHTTVGVTINENADPDVTKDLVYKMANLIPENDNYKHAEGNSDSHLKSTFTDCSQNFIIDSGKVILGIWQGIYFCEFDGGRTRTFYVKIIEG